MLKTNNPPLTRESLDKAGCSNPDCTHDHSVLFLHQQCHPHAPIEVLYTKLTGTLEVACSQCKRTIVNILVATKG